jgi:periplasmic protein TonB
MTLQQYRMGLMAFARQFKRYPVQAMERGWEGRVEIRITVRPTGAIESARVKTPSGYRILDDQALDMVKRALARTPVPPALLGREFSVDIPVIFELQSG